MKWDVLLKKTIFAVADNAAMQRFFDKYGMQIGVQRFVAAESLEKTVAAVKSLNAQGLEVTLDYLGESVTDREAALEAVDMILQTYDAIRDHGLNANVSVKLTQLGLRIDQTFCAANMDRIASCARNKGNFVRIDMEDSTATSQTLAIYKSLLNRFGSRHVGIVIQSCLKRSMADMRELGRFGANVRVVKGAYQEPPDVAYKDKKDVDANYIKLVKHHLAGGCYAAIATHDQAIIGRLKTYITERSIAEDQFEFQMLYGIASQLQKQLVQEGFRVRVYTPFGSRWYPYFTRRIAERPANLWFVLKNLLRR
ncbi:proline dehydrogenase family protein [Paenibacillus thalictri]|uniref:proline dehydrogenase n=1 Tax=Paenibacillus thalictri TaxID=2527873 RepID=A0A4Q9DX59_9BACL|nr:proline dehydrogenase family protein [Paenibacillus thalictri]TBL81697.1 proline dehydrogenase [Paenibacillus thalictri]